MSNKAADLNTVVFIGSINMKVEIIFVTFVENHCMRNLKNSDVLIVWFLVRIALDAEVKEKN